MNSMGRLKKKERKNKDFHVRMSEKDLNMIQEIHLDTGKSKTEIFENALDLYYKTYKYLQ